MSIAVLGENGIRVDIISTPSHNDINGNATAHKLVKEAAHEAKTLTVETQTSPIQDNIHDWQNIWLYRPGLKELSQM